jgi:hypothetical protein
MPDRGKAVAIDWDAASLISLREALPGWETGVVNGATAASPSHDGNPGAADLLVVKAHEEVAETWGLHGGQQDHARRAGAPRRHTRNLDRARCEGRWRDDGGQG